MKKSTNTYHSYMLAGCWAILLLSVFQTANAQQKQGTSILFDNGWKFHKGDTTGAEQNAFSDAGWKELNLPHDWSIEGPYDRSNNTSRGGGYLPGGIGWYRKALLLDATDKTSNFYIDFDGIMANSEVWINGHSLGKRPSGYISLHYSLTPYLYFDKTKPNIIAVRADNSVQPASRWYTGAGIYRHVHLVVSNPVHVAHLGQYVTTQNVSEAKATVQVQTTIENSTAAPQTALIKTDILDGEKVVSTVQSTQKIAAGQQAVVLQKTDVAQPALWSIDNPHLYQATTSISINKKPVDGASISFGIRNARFEAATGFWLNGKNLKIKGVCLHHDGGAVGAAVPLDVWKYRLQLLKDVGVNGIRTAHNEAAPEFLDLCDQMGFVVMDETFDTWNSAKSNAEKGYNRFFTDWWERDTRDIVLRDRNHPSIVIYSIGNEIHDNLNDSTGFHKYLMQQNLVHSLDSTRPVTMALFRPALSKVYLNGFANMMDVVGQNYRENELIVAHNNHPDWKVIGTENRKELPAWLALRDNAFMSGQFLWTGFDYLGESDWPEVVNGQGLYDRTGMLYPIGWQYKSWWSNKPELYVMRKQGNAGAGEWISDWSPTDIDTYDQAAIQVFSNCDEVELFLNGKSVGVMSRPADDASPRTMTLTFQKGTLKAVAKNKGKVAAEQELKTAGEPAKIVLIADKPTTKMGWDNVVYIRATITDANGNPCLNADNRIAFTTNRQGNIIAVDNGDLRSTEPYQAKERWAYKGTCIAIVKASDSNGSISVTATSEGLQAGSIEIKLNQ